MISLRSVGSENCWYVTKSFINFSRLVLKNNRKVGLSMLKIFFILILTSVFMIGCSNTTYFSSMDFVCNESVQGVSCKGDQYSWTTIKTKLDKIKLWFCVDESSSMNDEHTRIKNQFDDLMNSTRKADVQVALIVASPDNLGNFIPFPNGDLWLSNPKKRISVHKQNVKYFQEIIQRPPRPKVGEHGESHPEQCIASYNKALDIEKHKGFFEPHSLYYLIVVSDDDEAGATKQSQPLTTENYPETFFNKFNRLHPFSVVTANAIIFRPGDSQEDCPDGDEHGQIYADFAQPSRSILKKYGNILSGHIGSICSDNYSKQLDPIADQIMKNRILPLPCKPSSVEDVTVRVNGSLTDFRLEGRTIEIRDRVPFGAEAEVSFLCG